MHLNQVHLFVIRAGVKEHFRCFTLVYTRCNSADYGYRLKSS